MDDPYVQQGRVPFENQDSLRLRGYSPFTPDVLSALSDLSRDAST